jgi:hypothetical protein
MRKKSGLPAPRWVGEKGRFGASAGALDILWIAGGHEFLLRSQSVRFATGSARSHAY